MKYIECPEVFKGNERSLFIAGGISNCPDWQQEFANSLKETNLAILNPRRKIFPKDNPNIEEEQILWEHKHLGEADAVSFWFPKETLCPITLFELGKMLMTNKKIFVGVHPDYERKKNIEIQSKLLRQEIKIVYSLSDLTSQIKIWSQEDLNN